MFDCAFKAAKGERSIHYMGHIKMMGATQPFISGAISKTVNVPKDATVEDIEQAYLESWRLGAKAVSIYRDGSKRTQPLNTSKDATSDAAARPRIVAAAAAARAGGARADAPQAARRAAGASPTSSTSRATRATSRSASSRTGMPGEIFLVMAKEGSTISGFADAFAQAISYALQYGVPLQALVDKFSHVRFEPSGMTKNPDVRVRQVDRRLHLPLDGVEVPVAGSAVPRRRQQPRRGDGSAEQGGVGGDTGAEAGGG